MPSAAHLPDEDFINKSLLASLDADAEPHDAPDADDRFFQPNNAPALFDYPKFPHSNTNYRASFTAYPNTTRARHHAAAAHSSAHTPAAFFPPPDSFAAPYPAYDYSYKQQPYPPNNVQLSSQTPYGPHVPAMALAPASSQQPIPQSGALALNMPSLANAPNSTSSGEEISTIFVVGFPEDMQEREFQNMFTFSSGFEAATLKIPNKEYSAYGSIVGGPPGATLTNGLGLGLGRSFPYVNPNDPYSLVTVNPGGSVLDGAQSTLRDASQQQQQQQVADELSANAHYLGAGPGPGSAAGLGLAGIALSSAANGNSNNLNLPPRKQIIGFAKFRSREEALAARDILQGRRVDIEKGAVLKAEMAKKNLHTKRGVGPVPVGPGTGPGAGLQSGQQQQQQGGQGQGQQQQSQQQQQQQHMNGLSLAGLDAYNTDPTGSGVFGTSSSTNNNNNNRDSIPALARLGWRDSVSISNPTSVLQQHTQSQSQSLAQQHDSHQANGASSMTSPVLSGPVSSSSGEEERKRDSLLSVHLGGISLGSSPNMLHASVSSVNGQRGPRERAEEDELRERERERGERERGERDRDLWRRKEKEREKEINLMRLRATNPPAFDAFHGVSSSGSAGAGAVVNGSVNGTSTSAPGMSRQSSTASTSSGSIGGGAGVAGVWANTPNTNTTSTTTESVATSSPMLGSASSESYDHHLHQQHLHMREREREQQEELEEEREREQHEHEQHIAGRSQEQEHDQLQEHERDEPVAVLGPWDRVHGATSYAAVVGRHGSGNANSSASTNANSHSASHRSANSNGAGPGSVLPSGNANANVMSSSESERSTSPVGSLYQPSSVDGPYQHQHQQFQQQQQYQHLQQQQQQWYQPQYMHLHEQQQAALHHQQQQILFEQQQQNVYQSSYGQQHQQYRGSSQSESSETGSVVGAETGATSPRGSTSAANNAIGYVGARLGFGVGLGLGQQKSSAPLSSSSVPPTPGAGAIVPPPVIPAAGVSGESAVGSVHVSPSVSATGVSASAGETSPQLPSPASASGSGSGSAVGSGGGSVVGSGSVSGMSGGIGGGGGMNGVVGGVRGTVDQNPPINTLYVGNLPTSPLPLGYSSDYLEETLRGLFSACPGFRKLCFRQKANGPMCFIEFVDVQSATDALKLLSGNTLGGTVKNGIRLSYSKNPLGVRTPTSAGANSGGPTLQQQQQLMQTLSNHHSSSHQQQQHHHQQQYQSYQQQQMGPPPSSATSSSSGGGHDGNSFQSRMSSDDSFGMGGGSQTQTQHKLPTAILRRDSTLSPTTMASLAQAQQGQQQSYTGAGVNGTGGGNHVNANGNANGSSFFSSPPPRFYSTSAGGSLAFVGGGGGMSSTPLTGASSTFVPRSATNGGSLIGMFNSGNSLNGGGAFGGYGVSSTNTSSSSSQQQHQQASFSPFGMSFSHNQHSHHEMFGGPPLLSPNLNMNMNMNQHPQLQPLSIPGGVGDQLHLVQQVQGLVDD